MDRGLAVEDALPNKRGRAKACRISNKEIYRALGIENVRHRRDADDSAMLRRLLSLDYVLEHPELPWLPTDMDASISSNAPCVSVKNASRAR